MHMPILKKIGTCLGHEFHGSNGLDLVDPGVVYLLDLQSGAGDIFHVYYSFFDSQYESFPSSYTAIRM